MNKKGAKRLNLLLEIYGEKTLEKIDGFDNAVIGIEVKTDRLIYSVKKCVNILKTNMSAIISENIEAEDLKYWEAVRVEAKKIK